MSKPKLAERTVPAARAHRATPPFDTNGRETTLSPALEHLADTLRDQGHSVRTASMHPPWIDDHRLASDAAHFFDQALGLSGPAHSARAHIRLYHSKTLLFLQVTQLKPNSFESATRESSARDTLHELSEWSTCHGHPLSIGRGPRDQLRVDLTILSAAQRIAS